ncbi:MAG TPA: xanthine dehydrogenase family protein subunit M [Candidatus Binatia bacterium]
MFPASFGYAAARSVEEALELLTRHGEGARLLAGGQSLLPAMKLRLAAPRYLIDLGRVPGLSGTRVDGDTVVIGALSLHSDVASSEVIRKRLPGLAEAASLIGDLQVRNRGTIGGSVAHADPGADFPVILTALNASFVLFSLSGRREVSADDFFVDYFTTALKPDEVLTEIRVPLPPAGAGTAYAKLAHPATGYVVVSAGALLARGPSGSCAGARVALGGMGSGPVRARATEAALEGRSLDEKNIAAAAARAAEGTYPDEDAYAGADYRREVAAVYARRAMAKAAALCA